MFSAFSCLQKKLARSSFVIPIPESEMDRRLPSRVIRILCLDCPANRSTKPLHSDCVERVLHVLSEKRKWRSVYFSRENRENTLQIHVYWVAFVQSCLPSRGFLSHLRILSAYFPSKELRCVVVVLTLMLPHHCIRPDRRGPASRKQTIHAPTRHATALRP